MALALRDRITLACAPIGCIAFVALYIIAAFEDPDYVLFESYLSDLGVGPGAWAFNSGAVLSGCLLAVFAAAGFLAKRSLADVFLLVNACSFAIGLLVVVLFGPDPMAETIAVFSLLAWGVIITILTIVEDGHASCRPTT